MPRWKLYVTARKIGACGMCYGHTVEVEAATQEEAREKGRAKAYETLEHVSISAVVEVKDESNQTNQAFDAADLMRLPDGSKLE